MYTLADAVRGPERVHKHIDGDGDDSLDLATRCCSGDGVFGTRPGVTYSLHVSGVDRGGAGAMNANGD
jgi:hypothetical protein